MSKVPYLLTYKVPYKTFTKFRLSLMHLAQADQEITSGSNFFDSAFIETLGISYAEFLGSGIHENWRERVRTLFMEG